MSRLALWSYRLSLVVNCFIKLLSSCKMNPNIFWALNFSLSLLISPWTFSIQNFIGLKCYWTKKYFQTKMSLDFNFWGPKYCFEPNFLSGFLPYWPHQILNSNSKLNTLDLSLVTTYVTCLNVLIPEQRFQFYDNKILQCMVSQY